MQWIGPMCCRSNPSVDLQSRNTIKVKVSVVYYQCSKNQIEGRQSSGGRVLLYDKIVKRGEVKYILVRLHVKTLPSSPWIFKILIDDGLHVPRHPFFSRWPSRLTLRSIRIIAPLFLSSVVLCHLRVGLYCPNLAELALMIVSLCQVISPKEKDRKFRTFH